MISKSLLITALASVVLFSSCVSTKKYDSAVAEANQLKSQVADLQAKNADLTAANQTLTSQVTQYKNDAMASQAKLKVIQDALNEQYNTLLKVEQVLEKGAANFKDKGIDVYYKNGAVYVKLEEGLMYKPGSSELGENGKKALANLAAALNDYPKLQFSVVGNTDTIMYKGKNMDNWSLSTERANGVVRILRDEYKVDPSRITSSGRSKYDPVASNATAEGRAKNRRTEIILYPDLEKIWENVQAAQSSGK